MLPPSREGASDSSVGAGAAATTATQKQRHQLKAVVEKNLRRSYDWLGYIAGAGSQERMSRRPGSYQAKRSEDGMEALSAKLSADLRSSIRALVRREQRERQPAVLLCKHELLLAVRTAVCACLLLCVA